MIDLTPYIAKGFPGRFDEHIARVPTEGIDADQPKSAVRVCAETESALYERGYSPIAIAYRSGARPRLESIVATLGGTNARKRAESVRTWVATHVRHPHHVGATEKARAMSEEELIDSGVGWCNEQARVFVALCEVSEIPARMCFLFHVNEHCSHAAAEAFVDGRWAFFDPTMDVSVELPSGVLAEAREISGAFREHGHAAYARKLERYYAAVTLDLSQSDGWSEQWRPTVERGADLLDALGICNYLIDGVKARAL